MITKEAAMTARFFEHVTVKNKTDNTPARARRTGNTQVWKTRPQEFKIPVKHGLKDSFYITQDNAHEWVVTG